MMSLPCAACGARADALHETARPTAQAPDRIGPGRLIAIVGPSGAGKDTLIDFVKAASRGNDSIVFPQRIVTRDATSSEDNRAISAEDFDEAATNGEFAFHWQAHGLQYALPRSIRDDVQAGRTVVVNVSRTIIAPMRKTYLNVTVVLVTAPADVLAARLAGRDRTSDGDIAHRMSRSVAPVIPDETIQNIGSAEHHGRELCDIVYSHR